MKQYSLPTRSSAFVPVTMTHDAISTSSSTLVNPEIEEENSQRKRRLASRQALLSSNDKGFNQTKAMKRGLFTSDGWLKSDYPLATSSPFQTRSKEEYPDDHRCSDQETISGLCRCTQDTSPDSASSQSPMEGSELDKDDRGKEQEEVKEMTYDQQLLAARRRKLMSEPKSTGFKEENSERGLDRILNTKLDSPERSYHKPRDLQSDPILVQRPSSLQRSGSLPLKSDMHSSSSSDGEEWETGKPTSYRRWASSPIGRNNSSVTPRTSQTLNASGGLSKRQDGASVSAQASTSVFAPPSAARKSISNVFEKLLKEEEERREEERVKKEAARERRRMEKRRREEGVEGQRGHEVMTFESTADLSVKNSEEKAPIGSDEEPRVATKHLASSMPEGSSFTSGESRIRHDASRLQRLSKTPESNRPVQKVAPKPSPEKPAAEMYKKKLAALRSTPPPKEGQRMEIFSKKLFTPAPSPMFPGTYYSPSMARPSPSASYSPSIPLSRKDGQGQQASTDLRRTQRSSSPPLRAWTSSPLHQSMRLPRSHSSSSNLSVKDHSFSGDLVVIEEMEGSEEDQVTMGSDFQGQAPLQSTPPRGSPMLKSESREESLEIKRRLSNESPVSNDSLRQTLQQLKEVLMKVNAIKGEGEGETKRSAELVDSSTGREEQALTISQPVVKALVEETNEKANELDDAYLEKLGTIRKRLSRLSTRSSSIQMNEKSGHNRRSWFITLILQLLLAWMLILAAEMRAKQLFLTTYHDPFQPLHLLDIPSTSAGDLLSPLINKWNVISSLREPFEVNGMPQIIDWNWSRTVTWTLRQIGKGRDGRNACKLLVFKLFTLVGLEGSDEFRIVPT